MSDQEKRVNGLWIGKALSEMELLTLKSFLDQGHQFILWVYEDLDTKLPDGAELKDANEILDKRHVFKYPEDGPLGWSKGSYAGFSDIFRYKLLYEVGGWWVDMDVTCLKPFDFVEPYFFRNHWKYPVVGNVMKCPTGSELMKQCFQKTIKHVTAENNEWHKPIKILNDTIEGLGLMHFRKLGLFNSDQAEFLELYFKEPSPFPHDWYGVHWCKACQEMRYTERSTFNQLLKKYNIEREPREC